MGRIYKRGETWWAYYTPRTGEYRRESLKTKDREVAKARLRNLELGGPAITPETDPATLNSTPPLHEALTTYLATIKKPDTLQSYTQKARHLERVLGEATPIGSVTEEMLEAYIRQREGEGRIIATEPIEVRKPIHPSTIYKELVVLRGALQRAKLPTTIIPKLDQAYVPRDRWLTMAQVSSLIAELPEHRRAWVALAAYAGCRSSEVESVDQDSIQGDGFLRVSGTKTDGSWRRVPIAEPLRPYLKDIPVQHWKNVRRDLHLACKAADVPPVSPNDLRRTFASRLVQTGVPLYTVAAMMGHKSTRMIERVYGKLSPDVFLDAINLAFGSKPSESGSKPPEHKKSSNGESKRTKKPKPRQTKPGK